MMRVAWRVAALGAILALASTACSSEKEPAPVLVQAPPPPVAPVAPPPPEPPTLNGTGTVRVRILSAGSGQPLAGALAAIIRPSHERHQPLESAAADGSGVASFPAARAGLFRVCAQGPGHAEACEEDVGVVSGGTLAVELRLAPGGAISGHVRHEGGVPAPGVRLSGLRNFPISDRIPVETVTDAQGAFRLDGLSPGSAWVRSFSADGREVTRSMIDVEAGKEAPLDVAQPGTAQVTVRPVSVRGGWRGTVDSVTVNSIPLTRQPDGTYRGQADTGTQTVQLTGTPGFRESKEVKLSPGKAQTVDFPLRQRKQGVVLMRPEVPPPAPFELAGHVFLADGTPVKGARVSVENVKPEPCGNVPRRYSHFRFDGSGFVVPPASGSRAVYAWLDDGRAGSVVVTGHPGERVVANITLEETGAVAGRVPIPEEDLPSWTYYDLIVDERWFGAWQFTALDGSFVVAGLAPGEHVLEVDGAKVNFTVRARERTELGTVQRPADPEEAKR